MNQQKPGAQGLTLTQLSLVAGHCKQLSPEHPSALVGSQGPGGRPLQLQHVGICVKNLGDCRGVLAGDS